MDHRNNVLWPRKVEGAAGCYGWLYIYNGWLVIIVLEGLLLCELMDNIWLICDGLYHWL